MSNDTYPSWLIVGRTVSRVPTSLYCTTWSRVGVSVGRLRLTWTNGRWEPTRTRASVLLEARSTGRETIWTSPRLAAAESVALICACPSVISWITRSPRLPPFWVTPTDPWPLSVPCGGTSRVVASATLPSPRGSTVSPPQGPRGGRGSSMGDGPPSPTEAFFWGPGKP